MTHPATEIPTVKTIDRDVLVYRVKRRLFQQRLRKRTGYEPHAKQQELHDAIFRGATRLASVWGRRGGKSIAWADECVADGGFGPVMGLPKRLIRITAPEFSLTDPVFEYIWHWVVDDGIYGYTPKYARADQRYIEMPWNSRIECKTTDNPKALQGKGVTLNVSDEHADEREGVLKQIIEPTTFDTGGIIGLIGTPRGRLNHYTQTYESWTEKAKVDPLYFTSHATSFDNPYLDVQKLLEYRDECIRANCYQLYEQEVLAQFVSMAGAIYDNWRPLRDGAPWHVRSVQFRDDLPIYLGIDWGTIHNFVCLFGQLIDGDQLNIFDEISAPNLDPEQQVKLVLERLEGRKVGMAYCDPSGAGNKKLFRNYGIPVYEPSSTDRTQLNNVEDGILQVKRCFAREDMPGIVIDSDCTALISGVETYEWNDRATKAQPKKEKDDEVDALRYLVMGTVGIKRSLPFLYIPGGVK